MTQKKPILKDDARIGIANRGEAAIRFIRAVRDFNRLHGTRLRTAAFHLDRERDSLFAQEADSAHPLSGFPSFATGTGSPYLNRTLMREALAAADCSAVWVGWGFLSEDAEFVAAVEEAGLVFLGPSSRAMALLGDKIAAKELAERSSVPICPWSRGPVQDLDAARGVAEKIGYPVIVKASNAGGGRGIRFVPRPEDLPGAFTSAVEETYRITGNRVVFIERLVEKGRHLEVQVLADRHGNVRTFGVRDCSVQRKNQKIVEETPPADFDPSLMRSMEESAARLIRSAGYEGAGTVEFLYDLARREFYFMEVNTRLQVEHPITEQLYGVDLVGGQILVARNGSIADWVLEPRGAVVEVRLNAEDPNKDFRPAPGKVVRFKPPAGPGIRVDSGIEGGSEIPPEFDSMVAKIIAQGKDRPTAMARLRRALSEMRIKIQGGTTNRAFLLGLLDNRDIRRGAVHTRFVEELLASGEQVVERPDWAAALAAAAVEQYLLRYGEEYSNFSQQMFTFGSPRDLRPGEGHEVQVAARGRPYKFVVRGLVDDYYAVSGEGADFYLRYQKKEEDSLLLVRDRRRHIQIVERGDMLQVEVDGVPYEIETESGGVVKAPSPALVLGIPVGAGDEVEKGDVLLTLEAMKMEMIVPSPDKGVVREIRVKAGEQVGAGQILILLEAGGGKEDRGEEAAGPAVDFSDFIPRGEEEWEVLLREFRSAFSGFDAQADMAAIFSRMEAFVKSRPRYAAALGRAVLEGIGFFVAQEALFTTSEVDAEGMVRPAASLELLSHYFRRSVDREKGLPEAFLKALERVFALHGGIEKAADPARHMIYRIFKSRAAAEGKSRLLLACLFALERYPGEAVRGRRVTDLLDELALLTQAQRPSLADAAINARYRLFDREALKNLQDEKRAQVGRLLDLLARARSQGRSQAALLGRIHDLVDAALPEIVEPAAANDQAGAIALEALARRMNRDRNCLSVSVRPYGTQNICRLSFREGDSPVSSIVAVSREADLGSCLEAVTGSLSDDSPDETEILVFLTGSAGEAGRTVREKALADLKVSASFLCFGLVTPDGLHYETYRPETGMRWKADPERAAFHPLAFRELRIFRLQRFARQVLQTGEGFHLLHVTAKDNPRDERLMAFVAVDTTRAEFTPDGSIGRMVALEKSLMDGVYALRTEQIKRRSRLHWNRIVIHIRPVLEVSLPVIQDYAARLAARTLELGMERLTIYCRLVDLATRKIEERELLFDNIVGTSFTLSSREPSREPMLPMDSYVARVVRARQRGAIYPYEIIKMLASPESAGKTDFPPGVFEEFDLAEETDAKFAKTYRSVRDRPYGRNQGNLVFGLITNVTGDGRELKRVLILSDPTGDLGSLAEAECRRVNAALDLAEDLGIPAEFLPVSAGARIDMDSGTENLDWTASTLKRIIEFTQRGGELNIIVAGINVGAQSYWNAEATMLMHTRGLLIMTDDAAMLLTGKKALDFSGSVSAEDNVGIGGALKIMEPNGQAQVRVKNLQEAYQVLFQHYGLTYREPGLAYPPREKTADPGDRDVGAHPYRDHLNQGFHTIGDIFSSRLNGERKKPFDIRQVMSALVDQDMPRLERWGGMRDGETAVAWEARIGGYAVGLLGIESRVLPRRGEVPYDGPESWSGGTLYPSSSKKAARAINAWSGALPLVILANLSGFDGSPESLRKLQLEFGAEIGRGVVNFRGPIIFVVIARYHGGAYVVFSKHLNPNLHAVALEGAYASVIGGAPAAAVVFPSVVLKETYQDPEVAAAQEKMRRDRDFSQRDFDEIFRRVHGEKQAALAARFDGIHSVERARSVGSIDAIVSVRDLRPYLLERLEKGMRKG